MSIILQFLGAIGLLLALVAVFAILESGSDTNVIETAPGHFDRKKFHLLNWLTRAFVVGTGVGLYYGLTLYALAMYAYAGIAFWVFFEISICIRLFNDPFAVGTTANTDLAMRSIATWLKITPENTKLSLMILLSLASSYLPFV